MTADAICMRNHRFKGHQVLLIKRKHEPYKGHLAFPGGFVNYGENPKVAILRELKEETNLYGWEPTVAFVKGCPQRDPRKHVITIFYHVLVSDAEKVIAGDDAASAKWYNMFDIWMHKNWAFDHKEILFEYTEKHYPQYTTVDSKVSDKLWMSGIREMY